MSRERAQTLAEWCTELVRKGNDFPTVWATVLKRHPLVNGIPESRFAGERGVLVIRLNTGERLLFDGESKKFSVK
jgi:hypothetical protein